MLVFVTTFNFNEFGMLANKIEPPATEPSLVRTPSGQTMSTMASNSDAPRKSEEDHQDISNGAILEVEKGVETSNIGEPLPDRFLVKFDGPNDPGNPKNWTTKRRWAITVSMGLMVFTVTFASSIFSVNIGVIVDKFDVDLVTATLGVALFVLVSHLSALDTWILMTN